MITKTSLEKGLVHLLRPIVRLCVRYGVKIHEVELEIKKLFVQEAKLYLGEAGEVQSVSKISVMTGMQRPAVTLFLDSERLPIQESLVSKVIGSWCTKKKYVTSKGEPRILNIDGKESEFAELVTSVSQALNPYTVLFELERAKLIKRTPRGIELLTQTFNPKYDVEQSIQYLAADITDLAHAVEENINSQKISPNHHITTEYDNIPADKVPQIQKLLMREGDKFHKHMRKLLSKFDRDLLGVQSGGKAVRVAIGSFARCHVKR